MKILFIGCVESSAILLEELIVNGKEICGVVTKEKSSLNSDFVDLKKLSDKYSIPSFYYSKDSEANLNGFIRNHSPDLIYCFGWSHLLRDETLKLPKVAVIGFHPAALPKNRGRHPIIWALALGLKETASTFFYMDKFADDGDILSQKLIKIDNGDTARSLYDKILNTAKEQVVTFTNDFENGLFAREKQDISKANNWRKRNKMDGCIDFRMNAQTIYNLVRSLTRPYIGAHLVYKEKEYKVWNSEVISDDTNIYDNIEYGKVLNVFSNNSFLVKTGNNLIKILDCEKIEIKTGDYL